MIRRRDLLARLSFLGVLGGVRSPITAQESVELPPASPELRIQSFDGPLVVTSDLRRQRDLFEGGFGFGLVADQELDATAVKALFGVAERSARTVLLQPKGASTGVRLVEFRPPARRAARDGARPADRDALGGIDLAVQEVERTKRMLTARGFRPAPPGAGGPASGNFGGVPEGQVEGPDGVICAFRQMGAPLAEILSVSAPVSNKDAALSFYRDVLGLVAAQGHEAANGHVTRFQLAGQAPMITVVHPSPGPGARHSLRDRAALPNPGLQALRFSVPSVAAVARTAALSRLEVVAGPSEALLFPQGRVRSILIRAPHGVLHHFTETLKA